MHRSARGIIKYENGIILIHRIKEQKDGNIRDYYVIPGGKIEDQESEFDTVIREVYEEVGIKVKPIKEILKYDSKYDNSIQTFILCEYISGVVGTGNGPEYNSKEYKGFIQPEIIDYKKIKDINLVPKVIKDIICEEVDNEKKI